MAAFRIETDVLGQGQQDGTQWTGSLVLKGNGDPTLSRADLRALAAQVKALGIRSVTGGVSGDESAYDTRRIVAGWKPSFFIDESPPLSALVVDRARVGSVVTRTPALAAATAFRDALRKAGIAVDGPVRTAAAEEWSELLGSVSSPTLGAMVRFMDRESDNFTAEMLLKQLGLAELDRGTSAAGATVVMQTLAAAGVPMTGVRIVDGSGLSRLDRLTANALGSLLKVAWADPVVRPALLSALPVAGVNGTLQHRLLQTARAWACAGEDRHDGHRIVTVRLCQRPLRVRSGAERPSLVVLVGPPSAGPLRANPGRLLAHQVDNALPCAH